MDLTRRKNNLNDDDRCNRHNNEAVKAEKGDPIADAEVCKLFTPLVESQAHTPMMQELFGEDALGVAWVTFLEVLHKDPVEFIPVKVDAQAGDEIIQILLADPRLLQDPLFGHGLHFQIVIHNIGAEFVIIIIKQGAV